MFNVLHTTLLYEKSGDIVKQTFTYGRCLSFVQKCRIDIINYSENEQDICFSVFLPTGLFQPGHHERISVDDEIVLQCHASAHRVAKGSAWALQQKQNPFGSHSHLFFFFLFFLIPASDCR